MPAPVTDRLGKDDFRLADTIACGKGMLHIVRIDSMEYANAVDQGIRPGSNAAEEDHLKRGSRIVSHHKDIYTVYLLNGDSVVLKEDSSDAHAEEFVGYTYLGRLGDLPYVLFERSVYEGQDYLFVSLKNGSQTIVWGEPVMSPNGKYVLCSNYDLDTRMLPNGMQLFTPDSVKMHVSWKKEPELWGPVHPKWSGDSVIYFMQEAPDRHIGRELFFYAKVSIK